MPRGIPTRLLFAYGTLMRRGRLHRKLVSQGARYRGRARIRGRLFKISGTTYPGAVPTRSNDFISGELYELDVPKQALKELDQLEGIDEGLYVRKLVGAWMDKDRRVRAWAYFYAKPLRKSRELADGRFPLTRPAGTASKRGMA